MVIIPEPYCHSWDVGWLVRIKNKIKYRVCKPVRSISSWSYLTFGVFPDKASKHDLFQVVYGRQLYLSKFSEKCWVKKKYFSRRDVY